MPTRGSVPYSPPVMSTRPTGTVTRLLQQWHNGDQEALDQVTPILYDELRLLARRYLRMERADHTLEPTALVHEAFLRLVDQRAVDWKSRAHFFGIAAQAMRRILVDHARRQTAAKRGGRQTRVTLEDAAAITDEGTLDLVSIDDALNRLAELDGRQAKVVELRFFAALDNREAAVVLGVSPATVKRDWRMAKAWLARELESPD